MFNLMLIIAGECFRDGGQHSRKRDTDFAYQQQKIATNNHLAFIEKLKNNNVSIDVYIESYVSAYSNIMIDWYKSYLGEDHVFYKFHQHLFKDGRSELCTKLIRNQDIDKYDGIFIIRPDVYLTSYFFDIFSIDYDKITYPNRMLWKHNTITVNDMMMFIPKKFFSVIKLHTIKLLHRAIPQYIFHGFELNDFGFMIPTIHDSDTAKDYNPMYTLVSRRNTDYWHFYGYEVDNNIYNTIFTHKTYQFNDWNALRLVPDSIKNQIHNPNNVYEWFHMENNWRYMFKGIMEFDITNSVNNKIKLWPSCDQSYFKLENNQLLFLNQHNKITSTHNYIDGAWHGKYLLKNNIDFIIRPLIRN